MPHDNSSLLSDSLQMIEVFEVPWHHIHFEILSRSQWGQKSTFCPKFQCSKYSMFHKFAFSNSLVLLNSHFQNLFFWQNSHFTNMKMVIFGQKSFLTFFKINFKSIFKITLGEKWYFLIDFQTMWRLCRVWVVFTYLKTIILDHYDM